MNLLNVFPPGTGPLGSALYLAAGIVGGMLYFRGLQWSVDRFMRGSRMTILAALAIGRFALLGLLLGFAGKAGALPLLLTALGVWIGRSVVLRAAKEAAP